MPTFQSSGLTIAYDDIAGPGQGRPMILVHGFTSNRQENWQRLGWYGALERKRIRTIALDL
ncbi:MAG: alpha/beta hydrolase, partial [Alphaproteobacteria bacterium]|nr:alpha/beta hydrolase [Alphaproteobacteria bacterium]